MSSLEPQDPAAAAETERRLDRILRAVVTGATAVLLLAGTVLGALYLARSLGVVAAYGDARDYLDGNFFGWHGLHPNRGVLYAALVHLWNNGLSLPLGGLHALQVLCLFAGLAFYGHRLACWLGCEGVARARVSVGLAGLGLVTSPLLLHHALAVMPDALSTAWLLVVVVAVVQGLEVGERLRWSKSLAFLACAGLGAAFLRNEHVYVLAALALATALLRALLASSRAVRTNAFIACGGFLVCLAVSMGINGAVQRAFPQTRVTQYDMDDSALVMLVNRVSFGALPRIHDALEPSTRKRLPDPAELNQDSHQLPLRLDKVGRRQARAEVEAAASDVLEKAVRLDWHNFLVRYYRDWFHQLVPALGYPLSVPDGRPGRAEGEWTYSRTVEQSGSPRVVATWMAASQALFWALLACAALALSSGRPRCSARALLGTVVFVLLCATFYATITPSYNPRYTLPAAAVGQMTLLVLAASNLLERRAAAAE
jgi:hypothetical protein